MIAEDSIDELRQSIIKDLESASSTSDIDAIKVQYLGRRGHIQSLMRALKDLPADERPRVGKWINDLKDFIAFECTRYFETFLDDEEAKRLESESLDVTLGGRRHYLGRRHLINQVMEHVCSILAEMGFTVKLGPHVESEYYNFEFLNFEPDHPARDMQDTFYITDELLLRTQTTDLQGHVMEHHSPPLRIMAPGKVYRNESVTVRSHVFFHQVDVFYVDKGVSFADLMATKDAFLRRLFPKGTKWRFRPSYFPFVEPGMETDISCLACSGTGCPICKYTGWLEVSGSGMIHPEVLKNGGIDPEVYTGFAWGLGLERLVMLMYGIDDIRTFTQNDMRFLEQFA